MPIDYAMYDSLDSVAHDHAVSDKLYDDYGDWKRARDWDVCIMPDGSRRAWFPGFDMPDPIKRTTDEIDFELQREFLQQYKPVPLPERQWTEDFGEEMLAAMTDEQVLEEYGRTPRYPGTPVWDAVARQVRARGL